jgi:hypothetical protein
MQTDISPHKSEHRSDVGVHAKYVITQDGVKIGTISYANHYRQWCVHDCAGREIKSGFKKAADAKAWATENRLPSHLEVHKDLCILVMAKREAVARQKWASEMQDALDAFLTSKNDAWDRATKVHEEMRAFVEDKDSDGELMRGSRYTDCPGYPALSRTSVYF